MSTTRKASAIAAIASLGAATALLTGGGASAATTIPGCAPVGNVEAIIDDSGSMSGTDPNELRRAGLELFISSTANAKKTLGAVEFGSSPAETVFAPAPIGPNVKPMIAALQAKIQADNGGTDYDSGFQKAKGDNPGAQARIFLTDGANNGDFFNSHLPGPKTYVVGLGIGRASPTDADATRLQQIATDTGGRYFPSVDAAKLQPTFNQITSAVSCLQSPRTFNSRLFTRKGQSSAAAAGLGKNTKKVELVLNWAQPTNRFSLSTVQAVGRKNKVLASLTGKGKPKKLSVKKTRGTTFQSLSVKKPKGTRKLRFKVKAGQVLMPERTVSQLTQR